MKERDENRQPAEPDPRLDTPAEANREKHINFLDVEEESAGRTDRRHADQETRERQEEWQKGLEEGRKIRTGNSGRSDRDDEDPEST